MNRDYSIDIDEGTGHTVNVCIKLNDENIHGLMKKVVALYCERKKLTPVKMCTKWNHSKIFKKEPSFITYIKLNKYVDQFSLLNELLRGQSYTFENEIETKSFIKQSKLAINDFLDDRLDPLMKSLEHYLVNDIEKKEAEEMGIDIWVL